MREIERIRYRIATWLLIILSAHATIALAATPPSTPTASAPSVPASAIPRPKRQLSLAARPATGDFDAMFSRRMIRFLIPYSRTLYFNDRGRERGLSAELAREFERYLNKRYRKELGNRPITVYLIPTTRDKLLPSIATGIGDIAAGNVTVTAEREKIVDFAAPTDRKPVRELVVTGPKSPQLRTLDDLAGQTVYVRPATSYYESLTALNARFKAEGKAPIRLARMADALEDEDLLEMLNAGTISLLVVDDWVLNLWQQILPNIKPREDLVLRDQGHTGWAFRKNSPKLKVLLDEFYTDYLKKEGVANVLLARYMKNFKQITNNTGTQEFKRFEQLLQLFEKYGDQYDFDALMLAAQGYQESQLNQKARSHVGAIGVMQVMPATGREMSVGSIAVTEHNIHAAAKYMDRLMTRFFTDARFDHDNRSLFAFGSYNAGPGNIAKMRKLAAERGLDPDKWFNNVEIVVAERIGIETTTYVRNIYKYYAAYRLIVRAEEAREEALDDVEFPHKR